MSHFRWKIFLFGAVAFIGTGLLIYLVGEGVIYFLYGKEMAILPRYVTQREYNDYVIRGNIPNARYWHKSFDGRWKFEINAQGFRSTQDTSYEKPEGVLRVLVLGDSFTAGYEVAQNETYAVVLERELQKRGIKAEVINAGVSGFSNAEELVFLEQEGVRYRPDIVVLGFYANDLEDNIRTGLFKLDQDKLVSQSKHYAPAAGIRDFLNSFFIYRWLSERSYLHNYLNSAATVWFKGLVEQKQKRAIAMQLTPRDSMDDYQSKLACRLVERLHQVSFNHQALFILLEIPKVERTQVSHSWPAKVCSPESVSDVFVDGLALLQREAPNDTWYQPHGHRHWTPVSHAVAGRHLAELIARHPKILSAGFAQKHQK